MMVIKCVGKWNRWISGDDNGGSVEREGYRIVNIWWKMFVDGVEWRENNGVSVMFFYCYV